MFSDAGRRFTIREEGGEILKVYLDQLGILTAGVGHVVDPKHFRVGDIVSKMLCDQWFEADTAHVESAVATLRGLTQYEFDALCDFAFNVGVSGFFSSTMIKKLLAGDKVGAAAEFPRWNKGRNKAGGLIKLSVLTGRRKRERALFERGVYA